MKNRKPKHISEVGVDDFFKQKRGLKNPDNWFYAQEHLIRTEKKRAPTEDQIEEHMTKELDIYESFGEFDEVYLDETESDDED